MYIQLPETDQLTVQTGRHVENLGVTKHAGECTSLRNPKEVPTDCILKRLLVIFWTIQYIPKVLLLDLLLVKSLLLLGFRDAVSGSRPATGKG